MQPHLATVPLWLTGTIIGRDILLLAGLVVIHLTVGKVKVRPHLVGKVATVLQMSVVLWVLLRWWGSLGDLDLPGGGIDHGFVRPDLCLGRRSAAQRASRRACPPAMRQER